MSTSNFSGPVASPGGFIGPHLGAGIPAFVVGEIRVPLPVTAVANTDLTATVPAGSFLISASTYTSVAYGAATDATIAVGTTVGGGEYVAATTIKAIGVKNHTLVDAATPGFVALPGAAGAIKIRIVQTGTASATGTGFLCLRVSMPLT